MLKMGGEGDLPEIGEASGTLAFLFGAAEGRKEEDGQDCDNSDDDKELDQGKTVSMCPLGPSFMLAQESIR
jgi:hypothetical protein